MSDLSALSDADLIQKYQQSVGPGSPYGIPRITVTPKSPSEMSDAELAAAYQQAQPVGVGEDMLRSIPSGLASGFASTVGLPSAVTELATKGVERAQKATGADLVSPDTFRTVLGRSIANAIPGVGPLGILANTVAPQTFPSPLPSAEGVQSTIEKAIPGTSYQPQTMPGQFTHTAAEFVPGSIAAPGGILGNAIRFGILPGLASEAAGQATKGSDLEGAARTAAALGAGGVAALATRPGTAAQSIRNQLPPGITAQHIDQAQALMNDAARMGVTLSWPEALSQVAGRPVLSEVARHLEATPATSGRMATFYGDRPQQVETAGRQAMDQLGPATANPSVIGPQAGEAASGILDRVRGAINQATRPSYDAARQTLVPQQVHAAMIADPLFEDALNTVRNDPARNSFIRGLSDRSTVVYDAVKKELEERATRAANPVQPGASQAVAGATGGLAGDVRRVAVASDRAALGIAPGAPQMGNLEQALADQAALRQRYLEPLQRGPLGRIADKDITTQRAMDALFPKNPLPNSEQEISTAVRALSNRNPQAAQQLVRAHAESTFNEATQALQSGANQAGGAKFRVALVGNPQQAANFVAAVRALPQGDQRLAGFNRFLDVMEAIGTRQNVGSKTAYNQQFLKEASASGIAGEVAKGAANPVSRLTKGLIDKYENWRLGRNLDQLAGILTDPGAVNQLRAIAHMPPNSAHAVQLASRLAQGGRSATASHPISQSRDQ